MAATSPTLPNFVAAANAWLRETATELRLSRALLFLCDVSSRALLTQHRRL